MSVTFISYRPGDADYTTHTLHALEGASQSVQTQVVELITIGGVTYAMVIDANTSSTNGLNGWTPVLAAHVDGDRTLLRVSDWAGGGGTKPATGLFIGASGFVADMAQAVSVRGPKGDAGDLAALADGSIAKAKLSTEVQTSLGKADSAVQDLVGMTAKAAAGTSAQKTAHRDALGLGPIATMTLPEAQSAVSGYATSQLNRPGGFDVPCTEISGGTWRDMSDCGINVSATSLIVAPHANVGYASTEAGTGKCLTIAKERFSFDLSVDSFFCSFCINVPLPASAQTVAGTMPSLGAGYGFYMSARTTGVIAPVFSGASGNWTNGVNFPATVLGVACDGTDHTVTVAYDAPTRSVYYWLDGILRACWPNIVTPGAQSKSTRPLGFGAGSGETTATSFAAKFKNLKARTWPTAGLPLNIGEIVRSAVQYPMNLGYLASVWREPTKRIAYGIVGQSNELGSSDWPDLNASIGCPAKDSITANGQTLQGLGTTGSMHPQIAALGGKRGVWRQALNTAIGSTSICQYWAGQFVSWSAATNYSKGAYVIAAGNIYKFTSTTGADVSIGMTAASAPTWPASGTVVDNQITWTYIRAATGADVAGTVLTAANVLFDPNGALLNVKTQLDAMPSVFAGNKYVMVSIGQGDKTMGSTQAQYAAGIQSCTDYMLAQGYKVMIGFTCSGLTTGLDTWLSTVGKPGRDAALASYAGNPNVFAGADLYTGLGVLTVNSDIVGLKSDQLHLNRHAMPLAAALWDAALAAAGA